MYASPMTKYFTFVNLFYQKKNTLICLYHTKIWKEYIP